MRIKKTVLLTALACTFVQANAVTKLQTLLQDYCRGVVAAYRGDDCSALETCISDYSPKEYTESGPYVSISGHKIRLANWDALTLVDGCRLNESGLSMMPPRIDAYIASQQVVMPNATPLLRPSYDYISAEIEIPAETTAHLSAADVGIWRMVVATAYAGPVLITLTDAKGESCEIELTAATPTDAFDWCPADGDVSIAIENKSDETVSVFVAKN